MAVAGGHVASTRVAAKPLPVHCRMLFRVVNTVSTQLFCLTAAHSHLSNNCVDTGAIASTFAPSFLVCRCLKQLLDVTVTVLNPGADTGQATDAHYCSTFMLKRPSRPGSVCFCRCLMQ